MAASLDQPNARAARQHAWMQQVLQVMRGDPGPAGAAWPSRPLYEVGFAEADELAVEAASGALFLLRDRGAEHLIQRGSVDGMAPVRSAALDGSDPLPDFEVPDRIGAMRFDPGTRMLYWVAVRPTGSVLQAASLDGVTITDLLSQPIDHSAIDSDRELFYLHLTTGATSFARAGIDGGGYQVWEIAGAPPLEYNFDDVDGPSDVLYEFVNETIYHVDGDGLGGRAIGGAVLGTSIVVIRP